MRPIKFLPIVMVAVAGLIASCSTSKLAQSNSGDDVYNSVAKARAVEYVAPAPQQQQAQNNQEYDEYYGTSNPYYDMDYSSRINRFYNGSTFRGYYDPYYDNYYYGNSYGNNNFLGYGVGGWNSGYGLGGWGGGFYGGLGYGSIWNNPFYYGNSGYGWNNPCGWNSWGPYSNYDRFGWGGGYYGGGYGYGGGYYGGGLGNYASGNYRARPNSNDRGIARTYGGSNTVNSGRPSRSGIINSNGQGNQSYSPNNNNVGRSVRNQGTSQSGQVGRYPSQGTQSSRPTRNESYTPQQPQRQESRPTYSAPSNSGSGSSGSSSGGGSRPSRAGRG